MQPVLLVAGGRNFGTGFLDKLIPLICEKAYYAITEARSLLLYQFVWIDNF